jgi:hypothetical protein
VKDLNDQKKYRTKLSQQPYSKVEAFRGQNWGFVGPRVKAYHVCPLLFDQRHLYLRLCLYWHGDGPAEQ